MFTNIYKVTSPDVIEKFIDTVEEMDSKVLVKVDVMAICKADIRYFLGNRDINVLNHKYPLAPIHEAVGEVIKDPTGTYKKGDKVILVPNSVSEKYFTDPSARRCLRKDLGNNYYANANFSTSLKSIRRNAAVATLNNSEKTAILGTIDSSYFTNKSGLQV